MLIGVDASRAVVVPRTGTEQYSFRLIAELLRLHTGHRWRLYMHRQPTEDFVPLLDHAAELRVMAFPRLWTHARLSWEMLLHAPDLLFVPAHVVPLVHPRRVVAVVHDVGYLFFPRAYTWRRRLYLHHSTRHNIDAARHVIVDSEATRRDLVRHYHAREDRVTVVPLGCGAEFVPVRDAHVQREVRSRYGLPERYILAVGTLQPRKNLSTLFQAFLALRKTCDLPHKLVVAGKHGWLYEPIVRAVRELGLEKEVVFTGHVAQADLPAVLSAADVLAFPSLYEGFGLPALEAMACGTPVVASNVSSLPEVLGPEGLLVAPLDTSAWALALHRVLTDEPLREQLSAMGLARARRFAWQAAAEKTMAVLEAAARDKSRYQNE